MQLGPRSTLGDVLADWRMEDINSGKEARWFASLTDQIEAALAGKMRPVTWAAHKAAKGQSDVPFVAGSIQGADGVDFDVYIVPIPLGRSRSGRGCCRSNRPITRTRRTSRSKKSFWRRW